MANPRPYDFVSFDAPGKAAEVETARRFDADDLAAARAEGLAEGRRLAMESIAADEAAALGEVERARADLISLSRAFVEEFCCAIARERDIDAAEDMLRRLTQNSEDRRAAHLFVAARRFERIAPHIEDLIDARRLADFVSIEPDAALEPGECRLEWRGGELRRSRREIEAAVSQIFDSLSHTRTEPQ